MVDIFLDTQLLQCQNTTDTKQDFLLQTIFPVATIKLVSDGTVEFAVHFVVRIQQVKRDASNVYAPYVSVYKVVQIRNVYHYLIAVLIQHTVDRQLTEVLSFVVGNLLTIHRESLCEVAIAIQETDCTKVNIAIGSLFQVVAGKDTQTTGIYLKYLVQTIFHAEISNRRTFLVRFHIHVCSELRIHVVHSLQNNFVVCECFEFCITHSFQQKDGVMTYFFPQSRIKVSKQFGSFVIPRPPNVVCQFRQLLQFGRNMRFHIYIFPVRSVYITNFNLHCIIT